ncbi:MAG TPA: nucleoside monophosphate kinase [Candidatus Paceibacterota bacterium]|nr:nucleoside monophosphate kinase [Candidatus Paceibacterota bacterium]
MNASIYIFIGQSGAGKGTQAALLQKRLKEVDPDRSVLYLETGRRFRELIQQNTFTAKRTKQIMDEGKLPPSFLGVHAWTHFFIEEYDGEGNVVVDGTPRVADEVPILLSACTFYGLKTHVILIEVSDEWAYEKTKSRAEKEHRADDQSERDIWGRIQWFHESVVPTIELLRASPIVTFHSVAGEQAIEAVHRDICIALGVE